jgi:hypothetical protein
MINESTYSDEDIVEFIKIIKNDYNIEELIEVFIKKG